MEQLVNTIIGVDKTLCAVGIILAVMLVVNILKS